MSKLVETQLPNQLSPVVSVPLEDLKPYSFEINEGGSHNTSARKAKYNNIRDAVVHSDNVIEIADDENKTNEPEVIDIDNYIPKNNKRTYTKEVEVIELSKMMKKNFLPRL
ncbi:13426_t:CDS:2 [Funneliformis geosporum]|uniref:13426_t:CDS:1 n=1 Tax=Funneliformis geosporum TaxID=1117311 RepID=A0A9W4WLU3_9GLOM|nr:13426_t:CDS:2 [Funneliformis geosporum]